MPRDDQQFQKTLYLLDRGEVERGEALLRQVLDAAQRAEDQALISTVRRCLGELLIELDRVSEAVQFLKLVAALDEYGDLVAHERQQAIELLRRTGEA